MLVDHAGSDASGAIELGLHEALLDASAETILTTPFLDLEPVSGLPVRSVLTESVRKPSRDTRQPQHSESCWS
jgi:hypothetical protein